MGILGSNTSSSSNGGVLGRAKKEKEDKISRRVAASLEIFPTITESTSNFLNRINHNPTPLKQQRKEWVEERLEQDRRGLSTNKFMSTINSILEPVSRGVYTAQANIPGLAAFQQGAGNAIGVQAMTAPMSGSGFEKAAQIAGTVAGSVTNPSNISQGLATVPFKIGQGAAQRAAQTAPVLGNRFAQRGIEGATAGAIQGGVISGVRGETDLDEMAKNIGIGAGLGAAGDVALAGIGKGISTLWQRMKKNNIPDEVISEVLSLPSPSKVTDDIIEGLPAPELKPPTRARLETQVNPYREKFENLIEVARKMQDDNQFTPGREAEELESLWSQMAGREDVGLDDLIKLAYPPRESRITPDLVSRAREYQNAREVAGAPSPVLSRADRSVNPQGVLGSVEPTVQKVGRAESLPTKTLDPEIDEILSSVTEPRMRDRVYNYLDEAEKAARERIASRKNRLSSTPIDQYADYAIVMASKLGKGTIKATDFTEELVKEFGEQLRPYAEKIYNQTKEIIRTNTRKASKEGKDAELFNSGTGDVKSFQEKVNFKPTKKSGSFSDWWEKTRTQFVEDLAPLEGLETRVRGGLASAEDSLYKSARLYKGTPERALQVVTTRLKPIVDQVEKSGYSADDLSMYALARHAQDVNAAGYKSGFTNSEINDVLTRFGNLEDARQSLVQINRDMLKELADSGVISQQLHDTLESRWQNYIPMFRSFEDESVEFGTGLTKALANVSSPIKSLKGSERAVINPLENMVKNIMQSVNSSERNKVASQLAKLADIDDGSLIRKLEPHEEVGRKNVVNVKVNGEIVKYEVEPEVYKSLLNLDQESSNLLINILSKPASVLRAGATLTPEFALRNPIRDVVQAFITSNSKFNPITDLTAGLIQSISKGPLYRQWIDDLGGYGNVISMDRDVHRKALEKVIKQPMSKHFVNLLTGKSLLNVLRAISDTTESATKVGEYRAALRQGQTRKEAAYRSRDVMDFARAGSSVRQANKIVAFLNANIQGKSKIIRAVKENPVSTITKMVTSVTLPTVGIYLWNESQANEKQKLTIQEAPDWQKDTFWLIAIPGTDLVGRIPKPFDVAPLFANLPEKALDYVKQNDQDAFDDYLRRSMNDMALPVQISGLLPFIEGMANYSFFKEGNIIPQREENLEWSDQYDPVRTTETAKLLSKAAEKLTGGKGPLKNFSSPRVMDNTIQGLTAGLGNYATSAIDSILNNTILTDKPKAPEKRAEQRPLAKAFLVDPLQGGKSMEKFYDEKEKLTKERNSAKNNGELFVEQGKLKLLENASDLVSDFNKAIREIERSNLSAKEKRDRIEPLIDKRNDLVRKVMGIYND